jgi:probable rRNA maturation factor
MAKADARAHRRQLRVQYACGRAGVPRATSLRAWADAALDARRGVAQAEVVIRVVGGTESARLNRRYRHKQGPTNVLSFPYAAPARGALHGDLVICAPLVRREARAQGKTPVAHWAHLVVHGILHLRGYDHIRRRDAVVMERLEKVVLKGLGFADPYA